MAESKTPAKKTFSFGGATFAKLSPQLDSVGPTTRVLNVVVPFEEALKLSLVIDECVRQLNSYNRSTAAGKKTALNVAIHLDKGRVTINEAKL